MKNVTIRNIVTILMVVFVILAIRDYNKIQKRNKTITTNIEVAHDNNESNITQVNSNDDDSEVNEKTFYITGLDDVSQSDLEYTKQIIENFYGYRCVINESVSTPVESCSDGIINAFSCVNILDNNRKTLYLTNKLLVDDGVDLRGFTTINGETIIVRADRSFMKSTIIHEIGHTLGLEHCSDLTCVMAVSNDEQDSGDFCSNCKRIINR